MGTVFHGAKLQETWARFLTIPGVILAMAFATSSGDIFFAFNIGGLTVRISQLLAIILIFLAIPIIIRFDKVLWPTGFSALLALIAIATAFVPNSPDIIRNIGYLFWSMLSAALIFVLTQLYGRSKESFIWLFKTYIYSFNFPAVFGLFQFAAGLVGKSILVSQWMIPGRLVRINGFGYEPSYFAIYESLGWVSMLVLLVGDRGKTFNKTFLAVSFLILTTSLLLSTSKTAIVMVFSVVFFWSIRIIVRFFLGFKVKARNLLYAVSIPMLSGAVLWVIWTLYREVILILVNGLGILGGASHSVDGREGDFLNTVELFRQNPIFGVSFGGVGPSIYMMYHTQYMPGVKMEGTNVFAEILAGTGLFGFCFFLIYILSIISILLKKKKYSPENYVILSAMVMSLLVELALLTTTQNIFRPYVWNHIAVLSAGLAVLPRLPKRNVA